MEFLSFSIPSALGISLIEGLSIVLFVVVWMIFFREKIGKPIPNPLMQKYSRFPLPIVILWVLRAILLTLIGLLIALMIPERGEQKDSKPPSEAMVIVLDISKSMETDDLLPSRIEYAKGLMKEYLFRSSEFGMIIFAGKTFVLSPITSDRGGQDYLIETLTTDTINQSLEETSGTNIGDALIQASTLFHIETKKKHVLLITDGRANIGLNPITAAEILKTKNISVSILALGSTTDIALTHLVDGKRVPLLDGSGNTINGSVDLSTLTRIAEITSGSVINITSSEDPVELGSVFMLAHSQGIPLPKNRIDERDVAGLLALFGILYLLSSWFVWLRYKSR